MNLIRTLGVGAHLFARRRDTRVSADELDVTYSIQSQQRCVRVKNVSPTGFYLLTDDRWPEGAILSVILKKWTLLEKTPQPFLRFSSSVVRHGKDGVGLTFLYKHIDTAAWLDLVGEAVPQIASRDALRMLRLSRALSLLCRICPSGEAEILRLILDELAYESGENALDILVRADDLVSRRQYATRADVSAALMWRILFEGSKAGAAWLRQLWGGLLAAASLREANDEKSLMYADLLSKLNSVQLRILTASCARPIHAIPGAGENPSLMFSCTSDEIRRIAGLSDLTRIECDLDRLYELGLLGRTVKRDPFGPIETANLTPTCVGLTLYARCKGQLQPAGSSDLAPQMPLFDAASAELH